MRTGGEEGEAAGEGKGAQEGCDGAARQTGGGGEGRRRAGGGGCCRRRRQRRRAVRGTCLIGMASQLSRLPQNDHKLRPIMQCAMESWGAAIKRNCQAYLVLQGLSFLNLLQGGRGAERGKGGDAGAARRGGCGGAGAAEQGGGGGATGGGRRGCRGTHESHAAAGLGAAVAPRARCRLISLEHSCIETGLLRCAWPAALPTGQSGFSNARPLPCTVHPPGGTGQTRVESDLPSAEL